MQFYFWWITLGLDILSVLTIKRRILALYIHWNKISIYLRWFSLSIVSLYYFIRRLFFAMTSYLLICSFEWKTQVRINEVWSSASKREKRNVIFSVYIFNDMQTSQAEHTCCWLFIMISINWTSELSFGITCIEKVIVDVSRKANWHIDYFL